MIQPFLDRLPLVAILRGVTPEEVIAVAESLVDAGFAIIEVPLNSPRPLESLERLNAKYGDEILIGAGTVTTPGQVPDVAKAGARLIVMPSRRVARASRASRHPPKRSPPSRTVRTRSSCSQPSCSRPPC